MDRFSFIIGSPDKNEKTRRLVITWCCGGNAIFYKILIFDAIVECTAGKNVFHVFPTGVSLAA